MRAVVQRVSDASVTVAGEVVSAIGAGLLVLLGVAVGDTETDATALAEKVANLRLFARETDDTGDTNDIERSLLETGGAALVVSQFTLLGDCRKGRRPSWSGAAPPDEANRLYQCFVQQLQARGVPTQTGQFRTHMEVRLCNDGPVTVLLDSRKAF